MNPINNGTQSDAPSLGGGRVEVSVLVVGAGPAGSVCASLLHRAGIDCLLIDHATFPRDKICGGGLTPKAWRLLDTLMPGIKYRYNSVNHIRLMIENRLRCEFDAEAEIRIVRRREFDHLLLETYQQQGGKYIQDRLMSIDERPDGTLVATLASGVQVACQYIVGADGSNSHVRRHLTGNTDRGILAMEEYLDKGTYDSTNDIVLGLSRQYTRGGYFFRFPNPDVEVIGYGDTCTTPDRFRQVLTDMQIPVTKLRGAYIYLSNDYPRHDHILLIGDAGGFANRITCEGLYDAFITARNASQAIISGTPFSAVNSAEYKKMKRQTRRASLFFSATGFFFLKIACRFPRTVKRIFDRKMRQE